ncbi:CoA transferase [Porticoccaceae bacterium]|nr:CoA transferase [Porticoccaceae bacterium]MDA8664313.1 CoA transferase [Porticoccaceae bacterium]
MPNATQPSTTIASAAKPLAGIKVLELSTMITCFMASMTLATQGADVMENPQIRAIGALETYVTSNLGKLTPPTPPIQFDGKVTSQALPSPILGEQSRSILRQLGCNDATIEDLENRHIGQCV